MVMRKETVCVCVVSSLLRDADPLPLATRHTATDERSFFCVQKKGGSSPYWKSIFSELSGGVEPIVRCKITSLPAVQVHW
jgi:hypothetical protein